MAVAPAKIGSGDASDALLAQASRNMRERKTHHEHGGFDAAGKGVIAPGDASRHLDVDALIVRRVARDEFADQAQPVAFAARIGHPDGTQAARQACQMCIGAKHTTAIHRNDLVDSIAKNEAPIQYRHLALQKGLELAVEVALGIRRQGAFSLHRFISFH
ncbi:hypothetical protein GALL_531600 [mine drainage metagenome]|uniref:Uncharacterized protein n=1 Tax=mine drainage metagenome TaxID=410659 RepID=A0A1J5PCP4_9ZZZZ